MTDSTDSGSTLMETGGPRYSQRALLGRGGMGEVQLCRDRRIGRDVAHKTLRLSAGKTRAARLRFAREVRVQGRLEHPGIVPLYDAGIDEHGCEYFTMRVVSGSTLRALLDRLSAGDEQAVSTFSRGRLLGVFRQVCLTIEYAHDRGVIHRDLKPDNVMIGDFGEVYVLDWGVAALLGETENPDAHRESGKEADSEQDPRLTVDGGFVGTLGYAAPEQLYASSEVGPSADVYALGALLFELLTLERLHPGETPITLLETVGNPVNARASQRAPERDVPPELDEICTRATMVTPADRYSSVADLRRDLDAFLDGERNVEVRRDLAAHHVRIAEQSLRRTNLEPNDRACALREAGKALALQPENPRAREVIQRLFSDVPAEVPDAVNREVAREVDAEERIAARTGAILYGAFYAMLPVGIWAFALGSPSARSSYRSPWRSSCSRCTCARRERCSHGLPSSRQQPASSHRRRSLVPSCSYPLSAPRAVPPRPLQALSEASRRWQPVACCSSPSSRPCYSNGRA
jgi:serine/threonine protein kinase